MRCVIGIDGGTESLRAHVFDTGGRSLGGGVAAYATRFPAPGRAEQDPHEWWRALGEAVGGAMRAAGVSAQEVVALSVDTTSATVLMLDDDGEPLRPALLWMDVRAADEAAAVLATGDAALALNGGGHGPVSAEWMIPKALWLKRNERALYDRAATVCEYQDFIVRRLTGRRVASLTTASIRWHYRNDAGGWPRSLLRSLDLEELLDKWPAEVLAPGDVAGHLGAEAAAHLGLSPATRVVQGGADAFIGTLGLGVARPGQVALVTGSSHLQLAVTAQPIHAVGLWGSYADVVCNGRHILEGGQNATGSMIAWLRRLVANADLDALNREAAQIAPGSDDLVVLDHFQGNRTPHTDAASRGALVGLSLSHTRAHLFRAMMEGIAYGTRDILDAMAAAGVRVSEMTVGGGASRSPLWLGIHADIANVPVKVASFADAPLLGCAVLAAVGAGAYDGIDAAVDAMVRIDRVIEPDAGRAARYAELIDRYKRLYPTLKAWRDAR